MARVGLLHLQAPKVMGRKRRARSDRGAGLTANSRFLEAGDWDTPPPFCIDAAPGLLVLAPVPPPCLGPADGTSMRLVPAEFY